jgi:hypothetical protein
MNLYLSTHLSHIETLQIKRDTHDPRGIGLICEPLLASTLEKQMLQKRDQFDRREELGGLSNIKTWGLASYDGYLAACITLHPGDMAEYYIPSQERATIIFNTHGLSEPSQKREFFPWEAEIKSGEIAATQSAILDTVLAYEQRESIVHSALSSKIIYAAIMASTLVWDTAKPERLLLAENAARRLSRTSEIDLSPEIDCLNLLLSGSQDSSSTRAQVKQVTVCRSEEALSSPALRQLLDICTFCGKAISWESLTDATCVTGHPFCKSSTDF